MRRAIIKNANSISVRIRQRGREELSVGGFRKDMNVGIEDSGGSSKSILVTPRRMQKHTLRVAFNCFMTNIILKDIRVLFNMRGDLFTQCSRGESGVEGKGMKLTGAITRNFGNTQKVVSERMFEVKIILFKVQIFRISGFGVSATSKSNTLNFIEGTSRANGWRNESGALIKCERIIKFVQWFNEINTIRIAKPNMFARAKASTVAVKNVMQG